LARTIAVRRLLQKMLLERDSRFRTPEGLDTNVLCLSVAESGQSLSDVNAHVRRIYEQMAPGTKAQFIFSKTSLHFKNYQKLLEGFTAEAHIKCDNSDVELLRLCLMNPFIVSKETKVFYPSALLDELTRVSFRSPQSLEKEGL
jgi:hypothetical protein